MPSVSKPITTIICGVVLALVSHTAQAEQLTVDEIVDRTHVASYYQGKDGRAKVTMTIYSKKGNKRVRNFTAMRRTVPEQGDGGDQAFYIYFHKPSDVSRMVYIVHKQVKSADDRWLYLPSLDLVKRIAPSDERNSFVGSDWLYEDVSGRGVDEDHHKLVKTTKNFYVLEHKPKKPKSVEFSSYKSWIHRTTFLPTRVEYFDKRGKKYRIMTIDEVKQVQGYNTVKKATMQNLKAGTKTVLEYDTVKYNLGLPAKVFTERYLRRAPIEYLEGK